MSEHLTNDDKNNTILTGNKPSEALSFVNDVQVVANLATQANGVEIITVDNVAKIPGVPDKIPVGIVKGEDPVVFAAKKLFDRYRLLPERKVGTAVTTSLTSFIDLVNRHKTEHSAIFAETDCHSPNFCAVINYHRINGQNGEADYLDHQIKYDFPLSEEWKTWLDKNGEEMEQGEFAAFIEDRIADLATPEPQETDEAKKRFQTTAAMPAKMMELSRGLQINVESKVRTSTKLQSGESSIVFEEQHKDAAGKDITVPGLFYLNIPPFTNGELKRVPVRLRYRVRNGTISWLYQLYRPDLVINDTVKAAIEKTKEETVLPFFEGTPED